MLHGPWTRFEDVALATLEWVWWFNNHRLLEPIGDIPPAEFEWDPLALILSESDRPANFAARGSSSAGRARASQARGRGFEPRLPLYDGPRGSAEPGLPRGPFWGPLLREFSAIQAVLTEIRVGGAEVGKGQRS